MPFRDNVEQWLKELDDILQQDNAVTNYLKMAEEKTKVKRLYLVLGMLGLLFVFVLLTLGSQIVSNCIAFIYPAYASIKAIESVNKEDDTRWLTYWTVYGSFIFVESFTDILLFWIPFYFVSKCLFLIWCMMPGPNNGSDLVYRLIIRPFFLRHEKQLDDAVAKATESANKLTGKVSEVLKENNINDTVISSATGFVKKRAGSVQRN